MTWTSGWDRNCQRSTSQNSLPRSTRISRMAELIHPTVISNELFARCYRWQVLRHGGDAGSGNPSRQWQKDVDPEGVTHGLEVSGWRRSWLYAVAQRVDKDHWPSACGMSRFRIHALPLDPHPPHVVFIRCGAGGIVARVGMERSVSPHPGPLHEPECARPRAQQDPNWRGARIGSIAGSLLCVAAPGDGRTRSRPLTVPGFQAGRSSALRRQPGDAPGRGRAVRAALSAFLSKPKL